MDIDPDQATYGPNPAEVQPAPKPGPREEICPGCGALYAHPKVGICWKCRKGWTPAGRDENRGRRPLERCYASSR